jgi:hypothetical protein
MSTHARGALSAASGETAPKPLCGEGGAKFQGNS